MPCARPPSCPPPGRCTPSCAPAAGLFSSRRHRRLPRAFLLRETLPLSLLVQFACAPPSLSVEAAAQPREGPAAPVVQAASGSLIFPPWGGSPAPSGKHSNREVTTPQIFLLLNGTQIPTASDARL